MLFLRVIGFFVLNKIFRVFIDTKICKVNKFILFSLCFVLSRCKTSQTILIDVNFKRIKAGNKNVNSKIILKIVDQVRVIDVLGN